MEMVFYKIHNDLSDAFIDDIVVDNGWKSLTLVRELVLGMREIMVLLRVLRSFRESKIS